MPIRAELRRRKSGRRNTKQQKELRLRLVDASSPGTVVRISGDRCTIGGAPTCTVRLTAFGIRPLHCVILRSDSGWEVRSLSPDNRLNGQPFGQSTLRLGDRMELGPLAFQVLEDDEAGPPPSRHARRNPRLRRRLHVPERIDSPSGDATASQELAARIEQIERQLSQLSDSVQDTPDKGPDETVPAASAAAVERLTNELAEQCELTGRERADLISDRQRLTDELNQRMQQLAELEAQLVEQHESCRVLESGLEQERSRLTELHAAVEQSQIALASQQSEHEQRQQAWEAQRSELEAEVSQSRQQWSDLLQQVEVYQLQSERDHMRWQESEELLAEARSALQDRMAKLAAEQARCQEQQHVWAREKSDLEEQLAAARQQAESLQAEQAQASTEWQEHLQSLETQLQTQQTLCAQQQDQLGELMEVREQELRRCEEQELTIATLQQRCAELDAENTHSAQRDTDRRQWETEVAEFRELQVQWESDHARLSADLAAREQQIAELALQLERAAESSCQQRAAWEEERGQLLVQLEALLAAQQAIASAQEAASPAADEAESRTVADTSVWSAPDEEVPIDEHALPVDLSEEVSPPQEVPEPGDSTSSTFDREAYQDASSLAQPQDDAEIAAPGSLLSRLHDADIWMEQPASSGFESAHETRDIIPAQEELPKQCVSPATSPARPAVSAKNAHDDEESIENYMNRLLARLRGPDAEPLATLADPEPFASSEIKDSEEESSWQQSPPPQPVTEPDPIEFRPRSQAPELTANLAAMRALANHSARDAIARHKVKSHYYQVLLHVIGSFVILAAAICVFYEFQEDPLLSNASLAVGLAAAGYGLSRYWSFRVVSRRTTSAVNAEELVPKERGGANEKAASRTPDAAEA
jgi:hypothetical protein